MLMHWDERRDVYIAGDETQTIAFAADHWITLAQEAIDRSGRFAVALSGGSTPKAIFKLLSQKKTAIDWSRVLLFWSDERAVSPDHPDSNYHMAMSSGLEKLPILTQNIFRMKAEKDIQKNALEYEQTIRKLLNHSLFDLVMLGLGEDGHTASLFPETSALQVKNHLVAANEVFQKNTWRMTFTLDCINQSKRSILYALGESKQTIVEKVLKAPLPSPWPASHVGTKAHKALWILDESAAQRII